MAQSKTYAFVDCDMIIGGVPLFELKSVNFSRPTEKWAATADNSSSSVVYTKNAAHVLADVTIAVMQGGIGNQELTTMYEAESTYPYMIIDNNGSTIIVGECKVNHTDYAITNDPTDINWKLVGKVNVANIGLNS